jgi:L-histidine N-alpha-methyltransferase
MSTQLSAAWKIEKTKALGSFMSTRSVRAREIAGEKNYLQDAQQPSGGLQSPAGLHLEGAQQIHGQPQTREGQQTPRHIAEFADDVRASLTKKNQRELPSKYLYDELGSALFEAICVLPEYGLTRADARLLQRHAAEIVERLPSPVQVAELGSGSGKKTRWILEALAQRQRTYYYPIEISASALAACEKEMGQIDLVSVVGYEETYLDGLRAVASRRNDKDHLLVLFLGSTIGNFDRGAGDVFLHEVRKTLRPGDALLLGTDLVKDVPTQILAYDDPAGVTAAFNLNLLARINRELGGDFNLSQFRHEARWNEQERRIEMHLRSTCRQVAHIAEASLNILLEAGETIWTESSHKYHAHEVPEMARRTGFHCVEQWLDAQWPFAQNLLITQ